MNSDSRQEQESDSIAMEAILSTDRFARYLAWGNGNRDEALRLYELNVALSEALYRPLHMLEVALRNRIHVVMSEVYGERWFDVPGLLSFPHQHRQLGDCKAGLIELKRELTPSRIVAGLTFGFWVAMLSPTYEDLLWRKVLYRIATGSDGKHLLRKKLTRPLTQSRVLRNRVAHHEPIINWDLSKRYASIVELTGWLSPAAGKWLNENSHFPNVYPEGGIVLAKPGKFIQSILDE